ncbi:hypothetical protein ACQKMV_20355 [Lysinibacillus sp. NPDC094403]|uniref:hypothetical protein n=1 Tax=Lysinibacillus sp. NPDC094403 TaxID=3390581 RepID=UPI003CFC0A50
MFKDYNMNQLVLPLDLEVKLQKNDIAFHVHCLVESIPPEAFQVQSSPDFIKAKNVLFKIAMDIKEGVLTVTSTLRAVFEGAYNKTVGCLGSKES